MDYEMDDNWPIKLFKKSVLKQTKYNFIIKALGNTSGKRILEIGSDNGVYSYLFRQMGGIWKSADVDERSVNAMRELVKTDVYRITDGKPLPFSENEFDCVIIVDILEHLHDEKSFLHDIFRVLKPGGHLIVNVPNLKDNSLLIRVRNKIGMTDASHGHVRSGYTYDNLRQLLGDQFTMETYQTHTKFFSKLMDTLMVLAISNLKQQKKEVKSGRGVLVTGKDIKSYRTIFSIYSIIYPFIWIISNFDRLLFFRSGYMIIATGCSTKVVSGTDLHNGNNIQHYELTQQEI
jgi:ubiquinone/menaquinone biosynthesis C-methylase UbiE